MKKKFTFGLANVLEVDKSNPGQISSRAESAITRGADVTDWNKDLYPESSAVYDVKFSSVPGATVCRVLYSESGWHTDKKIASWKTNPLPNLNTVSAIDAPIPMNKWELEPLESNDDIEKRALLELAKKEIGKGLDIKVSRVFKAGDDANGVVKGKILAVSENYAAQALTDNNIMLHEQRKLSRNVNPGEYVTFQYENGVAKVFNGCLFDISVKCDGFSDVQLLFFRKCLQDAISMYENAPCEDSTLVSATLWAKERTIQEFKMDSKLIFINSLKIEDTYSKPAMNTSSTKRQNVL